eukprot:TRINITY_DN317_c0_g1_i1.p1 TRINITY_DN317_c0_g1~~TRINITY_DN317_c0_g1_i1.p1  ORF type:complete len:1106 (+),score=505.33 TRINITY_DN317_c0_g1_i1:99-3416(+)
MAAISLLACAAVALDRKHINGDSWVSQAGGYKYNKTIPYWTDKVPKERGAVPYSPPADWKYSTQGGPVEGKINVHLVPHSHDDTGWQVTVDQYFYEEVYYVLDTLLIRLQEDKNRRFMFVETGFFARWWDMQPAAKKAQMKALVQGGQMEFVNGGWCMHDEAAPNYVEMIDQTTRGHQYLYALFGEQGRPKGSWTIDPFGHSNTNAWLIGAESGMDYLFWGRMDYQDFNMRKPEQRLEWVWEGSESLGSSAQIFAGELFGGGRGGYSTWFGFDGTGSQVRDDPRRHDYNVDQMVDQFVQHAQEQAASTRTDHQMWACGGDFNYQNADHWYHNLDKLIHYINQNASVNAFYSTPSLYVEQKQKANLTWEVRRDDIFPLGDGPHHYWSGYFTSRPALKKQVHVASNFLNAARQLEVISGVNASQIAVPTTRPAPVVGVSWTDSLEGTVGVATHHDGMSGTERQDVADDYAQRISESHGEVEQGVALSLQKLMGVKADFEHCNCNSMGGDNCLNITMCELTASASAFTMVAWNPLARTSTQSFRLPVTVAEGSTWRVFDSSNAQVACDLTELDERTRQLPLLYLNKFGLTDEQVKAREAELANKATHVLSFVGTLPPIGYSKFYVQASSQARVQNARKPLRISDVGSDPFTISNDMYELEFDTTTGLATKLTNRASQLSTPFVVTAWWYNSSAGGCTANVSSDPDVACDSQKSGAYMFRPNSTTLYYPGAERVPQLKVVIGEQMQEVHQVFSEWATVVYRLWKASKGVEVEYTVGPIPVDTPWLPGDEYPGKEVILRYSTGLQSEGVFYTDSNGREMVKRVYNKRGPSYPTLEVNEPVAGNYYPVNAMIALQDNTAQLAILPDVTQGGASLKDGELEMMVHRRLLLDDDRGVQEPLNETMCGCNDINADEGKMGAHGHEGDGGCLCEGLTMRGTHMLLFDTVEAVNVRRRQEMEELAFPATLAFAAGNVTALHQARSFIAQALPDTVKLLTLNANYKTLNGGKVLLRLAHLYGAGESTTHSVPVTVDLAAVFSAPGLTIKTVEETQLTGTRPLADMDKSKFHWRTYTPNLDVAQQFAAARGFTQRSYLDGTSVTIRPMEVRTYLVTFA